MKSFSLNEKLLFFSLIGIAIFLRFFQITQQGFLYWDEGMYMNEAKFYTSVFNNLPFLFDQIRNGFQLDACMETLDGWLPSAAKHLHSFFIFLVSLVIGLKDSTGQITSALFGTANCALLFYITQKFIDKKHAWVVLFLMTTSSYQIMFSRAGFPEMDSLFFFLLTVHFYLSSHLDKPIKTRTSIFTGIFYAITLMVNYRWFITIPLFVIFELLQYFLLRKKSKSEIFKRLFLIGSIASFVVLCIDLPYLLIHKQISLPNEFKSFHFQFTYYIKEIFVTYGLKLFSFRDMYFRLFFHHLGILLCLLFILGSFRGILTKLKNPLVLFSLLTVFFIMIGLSLVQKGHFTRYNSIIYPFAYLIVSIGLIELLSFFQNKKAKIFLVSSFIILTLLQHLSHAIPLMNAKSGYREVAAFLRENDGEASLGYMNSALEFYFGRNVANRLYGNKESFLQHMQEKEYKYLVVDYGQYSTLGGVFKFLDKYLRENKEPVIVIDNPLGKQHDIVMENLRYEGNDKTLAYSEIMNDPYVDKIRIYETKDLVEQLQNT